MHLFFYYIYFFCFHKGKLDEALKAFEALVQKHPQSPRSRYGKAQVQYCNTAAQYCNTGSLYCTVNVY